MEPTLTGVPRTTLWTLFTRAVEAERPDSGLVDPEAVDARDAIGFPYRQTFGTPTQVHALRARAFDGELARFLDRHPGATVVALGEGLQTTFWRLARAGARIGAWVSVDLPEVIALRASVLPAEPRIRTVAGSALDLGWMPGLGDGPVIVTAEGLLMYFRPDETLGLIAACAARLPGGAMLLDTVPPWFSRRTLAGYALTEHYTAPPMPWGITVPAMRRLRVPGVSAVHEVPIPPGRGAFRRPLPQVGSVLPVLGAHRPALWRLEFSPLPGAARRGTGPGRPGSRG